MRLTKHHQHLKFIVISLIVALAMTIVATDYSQAAVKPKKITLKSSVASKTIYVKGKTKISVKSVKPKKASKKVTFKSANKKIATVTQKGVVTGRKPGKVKIIAVSKSNKKAKASVTITVKKKPVKKPKPKPEPKPQPSVKLADGTWYGTGTWSRYYTINGPDVVKVTISGGKIKEAEGVVYTDDVDLKYKKGKDILRFTKGKTSVDGLVKEIHKQSKVHDAISGATETADGHLSAVKNALKRSAKFEKDKIEQTVDYVTFKKRPSTVQKGKGFNLKDTVMQIHQPGKDPKLATYDELAQYGIESNYKDGDKLPPIGTDGVIHFKNNQCLIDMPTEFQVQKDNSICEPTHILLKNKKGIEKRINLSNDKTAYKVDFVGEITLVALYYHNRKLVEGNYDEEAGDYTFSLKGMQPPAGADKWIHENYNLLVNTQADTSAIASFKVIDSFIKKDYNVGQTLDLGSLRITAVTKEGSKKRFVGWDQCAGAGFMATPSNGYQFAVKDCGKMPVKIQYKDDADSAQTFTVEVVDEAD